MPEKFAGESIVQHAEDAAPERGDSFERRREACMQMPEYNAELELIKQDPNLQGPVPKRNIY